MQITPLYTPKNSKVLLDLNCKLVTGILAKISLGTGFGPNLGWELGFGTPLHDPPNYPSKYSYISFKYWSAKSLIIMSKKSLQSLFWNFQSHSASINGMTIDGMFPFLACCHGIRTNEISHPTKSFVLFNVTLFYSSKIFEVVIHLITR